MTHYLIYVGRHVALAVMQREYIETHLMPWINSPTATAGVLINPPVRLEDEIAWYEEIAKDKSQRIFAILVRDTLESDWRYVGHTGLHRITWPNGTASTGTFIGDETVHGKGYGSEAKVLLLRHAFRFAGLRKITSEVKAFNDNSFGHLLKCGYKIIGVRKNHHFYQGDYVDEILFEVFNEDFEPVWKHYEETGTVPKLTTEQLETMKSLMKKD